MKNKKNNLNLKPKQIWEFRNFPRGTLLESGLVLNETASLIYRLCSGKNTISQIISRLSDQYDENDNIVKKDVFKCVNELFSEGAVKFNGKNSSHKQSN